jgi:hypothetical protein
LINREGAYGLLLLALTLLMSVTAGIRLNYECYTDRVAEKLSFEAGRAVDRRILGSGEEWQGLLKP